jgi:hypothetical protein
MALDAVGRPRWPHRLRSSSWPLRVPLPLPLLHRHRQHLPRPIPSRPACEAPGSSAPVKMIRSSQRRRRHKVFVGMAPGVGKTCRMLQEGQERCASPPPRSPSGC